MKRSGKIAVCLAGALALNAGLRAQDTAMIGNPYAQIVARNPFGLLPPPPPVDPKSLIPVDPPPKITVNGIMDIFGEWQALFKVAMPAKNGKPAADMPYTLTEGEGQDDIEVTKIDDKAGIVTFNNHGVVQEIPLASASTSSSPSSSGMNSSPANGIAPNGNPGVNQFNRFSNRGVNSGGVNPASNGGFNPNGGASAPGTSSGTPASGSFSMTPDEQVILIEAQRLQYQDQGDPRARIMPITPITPTSSDAAGNDGVGNPTSP